MRFAHFNTPDGATLYVDPSQVVAILATMNGCILYLANGTQFELLSTAHLIADLIESARHENA